MKKTLIFIILLSAVGYAGAQDKKEMDALVKQYGAFIKHKPVYKNDEWAMCKLSVVYKLSSAMIASDADKAKASKYGTASNIKQVAMSGAFALLDGLTEEDLQKTTDAVAEVFIRRMKEEAGVDIITWEQFGDNKETADLQKSAEETELYNSQGLAYAKTYQGTPHYNRVIVLVPGGKKLSKELKANVAELAIIVDFAEVLASADAKFRATGSGGGYVNFALPSTDQSIVPGVRITPDNKSQDVLAGGSNLTRTGLKTHNELGHMFYVGLPQDIVSGKEYATGIEESSVLPELFLNRKNSKISEDNILTLNISTTQPQYQAAVLDAFNQYMDTVIKIYNYGKGGK